MKLVFVYNVKSDPISIAMDVAHKVFSPSTYECDLCELTYSNLGERKVWKNYRKQSDVDFEFIYKNQLKSKYGIDLETPVILICKKDNDPKVLISAEEFKAIRTPDKLIQKIGEKLG